MPARLFNLRNVPEDEAEDIRALLNDNAIDFYETPAGNWGISMPAMWVKDEFRLEKAKALIKNYQEERAVRVRNDYEEQRARGNHKTLLDSFRENPLRFIAYLLVVCGLLYLTLNPFISHFRA